MSLKLAVFISLSLAIFLSGLAYQMRKLKRNIVFVE